MQHFANHRKLLAQIQRLGCLNISRAVSTTPTGAPETILNLLNALLTIHLQVNRRVTDAAYRFEIIIV